MNILHVGKYFPPPYGGMETVLSNLVEELSRHVGLDVAVANTAAGLDTLNRERYRIYKFPTAGHVAGTPVCFSMPYRLRSLFRKTRYDLVHLHFPNPMAHFASEFLPRQVPVVISWHSDIVRQKRLLWLYRPFLDRILRRAAAVVAATPKHFSSSTQLAACGNPQRRYVVPYGLDADRFARIPPLQAQADDIRSRWPGQRIIFSVGRHVPYKGFEFLIRAMPRVRAGVLLIAGTGPLTGRLISLTEALGLRDRVRFLGAIPDEDLPAYYHAADVFCLPSVQRSEAFGLAQLEAMLCGKPVVSCRLDTGVDYVNQHGRTGFVVPPQNPGELVAALNQLLQDQPLCRRLGENAHKRAATQFSLEAMREGTLDVYREVLNVAAFSPPESEAPTAQREAA